MDHLRWSLPGWLCVSACSVDDGLPMFVELDLRSAAVMVVMPRMIEFGVAGPGESRRETLAVMNAGGEVLRLDSLMVVGSEMFSLSNETILPLQIAPHDSLELDVTCAPGGWGEVADVVVVGSDPRVPEQVVTLYGGRSSLAREP